MKRRSDPLTYLDNLSNSINFDHNPEWGIGPDTLLRHVARSPAATVASFHEIKPNAVFSFSAVLRQVSFGLPRLLLPSGAHVNAVLGCLLGSILRTWPMNLQRHWKICSLMVLILARFRITSFDIFIGQ